MFILGNCIEWGMKSKCNSNSVKNLKLELCILFCKFDINEETK